MAENDLTQLHAARYLAMRESYAKRWSSQRVPIEQSRTEFDGWADDKIKAVEQKAKNV